VDNAAGGDCGGRSRVAVIPQVPEIVVFVQKWSVKLFLQLFT
jgi:hypothetical protein